MQEVTDAAVIDNLASALQMQSFIAQGNGFSIALLSRWPILGPSSTRPFPPIRDTILDAAVEYQPDRRLWLIGVHPIAFPGTFFEYWRRWELGLTLKRAAKHQDQARIIAGDFNAIAPGDRVLTESAPREMKLLYGLQRGKIYTEAMERMTKAGFTDCYRHLHPGEDGFTIQTPHPKVRLDYICANRRVADRLTRCEVIRQPEAVDQASDHYPLLAEFDVE